MRILSLLLLLGAIALLPTSPNAEACAPAYLHGERVSIASEDALIVWDAKAKVEHFIRRANFRTTAKDIGFLVPTPTKPELGEASDHIFTALATATAPRVEYRTEIRYGSPVPAASRPTEAMPAPRASVEVLGQQKVAGYDATILRANDATALRDWLTKHGYEVRPALAEWLKWYVDNNWIITAFKLTKNPSLADQIAARSVRLTFKTDTPFYPYREPEDLRSGPSTGRRTLRLFFLSDQKHEATLGVSERWPAKQVWANRCPDQTRTSLADGLMLPEEASTKFLEHRWHLSEFKDESSPRPGTDEVYFRPAQDQSTIEKPPIIHVHYEYRSAPGRSLIVLLEAIFENEIVQIVAPIAVAVLGALGFLTWSLYRRRRPDRRVSTKS